MGERITVASLHERCANVNRRIESSGRAVYVQGRNGYFGLDEYELGTGENAKQFMPDGVVVGPMLRTITCGTKREVGEFLHAMMVGIDLSHVQPERELCTCGRELRSDGSCSDGGAFCA